MKIAVIGSRGFDNWEAMDEALTKLIKSGQHFTLLVGDSPGVDRYVQGWCKNTPSFDAVVFHPIHLLDPKLDFETRFFFIRSKQLIHNCDSLLLAWDGKSQGTEWAKEYAEKQGKEVFVI